MRRRRFSFHFDGGKVRLARRRRRWSRLRVASDLRVPVALVALWERGDEVPSATHGMGLACIFGVRYTDWMSGDDRADRLAAAA